MSVTPEMCSMKEKTSLWLTADDRVKRSRSPPAVARSDGNMLLQITVASLSPWKMASCLSQRDIYLNKVLRSVFDEGLVSKHPTHYDSNVLQRSFPRSDRIWWQKVGILTFVFPLKAHLYLKFGQITGGGIETLLTPKDFLITWFPESLPDAAKNTVYLLFLLPTTSSAVLWILPTSLWNNNAKTTSWECVAGERYSF